MSDAGFGPSARPPILQDAFAQHVAFCVRRQGHPFVHKDDVHEVYGGGHLIDGAAERAIREELRARGRSA